MWKWIVGLVVLVFGLGSVKAATASTPSPEPDKAHEPEPDKDKQDGDSQPEQQPTDSTPNPPSTPQSQWVKVTWKGKEYDLTREIVRGQHKTSDFDDQVVTFYSPNIYGAKGAIWWLQLPALIALEKANAELIAQGSCVMMVSAGRTKAQQEQLKRDKPGLAASVEGSKHPRGLAVDMRLWSSGFNGDNSSTFGDQDILTTALEKHGWKQTLPSKEPWHYEYKG